MTSQADSILQCFSVVDAEVGETGWVYYYINFTHNRSLIVTTSSIIDPQYVSFLELSKNTTFLNELTKLSHQNPDRLSVLREWCDEFKDKAKEINYKRNEWIQNIDHKLILASIINSEITPVKAPNQIINSKFLSHEPVRPVVDRFRFGHILSRSVKVDNNQWPCMSITGYFIVAIKKPTT